MMMNNRGVSRAEAGFSLMEVAVALFIVGVLASLIVPLASSLMETQRSNQAQTELQTMYTAIVGNSQQGTYGYLGDVGDYPSTLTDLLSSGATGWNGPYVANARVDSNLVLDPFGGAVEYFQVGTAAGSDYLGLISKGPDRGSTNPNQGSNARNAFTAATYPWLAGYSGNIANTDNIVYPNFLDNAGLVAYPSVGTLAYSMFNFDSNALVNNNVPGCPALYTMTFTSVPRGSADQFTLAYNPGGAAPDLTQGLYTMRVTSPLAANALYQEQAAAQPGGSTSRTVNLGGLDSSVTSTFNLTVNNQSGGNVDTYRFTTKINVATLATATSATYAIAACAQVVLKRNGTNVILDSFVMPNKAYTRRLDNPNTFNNLQVTNGGATATMLKVYQNGLLIGTVSFKGNKKTKTFANIKVNDTITFEDQNGTALGLQTFTMAVAPSPYLKNVP